MSTRCTVHFHSEYTDKPIIIYKHHDGYPFVEDEGTQCGMLPTLEAFFSELEETHGHAIGGMDADGLATYFMVWLADWMSRTDTATYDRDTGDYDESKAKLLQFHSVQIMTSDPGDIQYRYHVRPLPPQGYSQRDNPEYRRPNVTYDERHWTYNEDGSDRWTTHDANHFFKKEELAPV